MNRGNFGSSIGVLLAMAGSAIGLGNLWRFPHLMGSNGGAAFLIIYVCFVFLLCLPIMFSEFIIGRRGAANTVRAYKVLAPKSQWHWIGIMSLLASLLVLAFYSVVGGWTLNYIWKALRFSFTEGANFTEMYHLSVTSTADSLFFSIFFLLVTAGVIIAGVKNGIEKWAKILMPALFIIIIMVAIRSLTLPNATEGLKFMFSPDFSKITGDTVLAALGQAFFSLSLGMGCVQTYASYVDKKDNIVKLSSMVLVSDTLFAIIAGIAIMPAVFSFGVSPEEGPGLLFVILPDIFSQLPFGGFIAIFFFFMLFVAALTSSISMLEVLVAYVIEEMNVKRVKAVFLTGAIALVLVVLNSLSQGVLSDFKILGYNMFDICDKTSANILLPLGGMLMVIFVGWRLKKSDFIDEITSGGNVKLKEWFLNFTYFIIKFVAPIVVAVVMISSWLL